MPPEISVVCPTFNSSSFVLPTLESVVNQTLPPFEIVISDDGSTDDTISAVTAFLDRHSQIKSKIISNPHLGPGAARNAGLRAARGPWVSFIDSDDLWLPRKLEVVAQAIAENPEANFFCHSEQQVQKDGTRQLLDYGSFLDPRKPLPVQLYYSSFLSTSAITCCLSLVCEAGLFDETLMSAQDYELWLRMSPGIKPHFIREVLGLYCEREGNITSSRRWLRWKNLVRIAFRHRTKATSAGMVYRVLRLTAAFGAQALNNGK